MSVFFIFINSIILLFETLFVYLHCKYFVYFKIMTDNFTFNIINGDCLEEMKKIPDKSVDLILTDPPYIISRETNFNKGGGDEAKYGSISMDFGEWDKEPLNFDALMREWYRILKDGGTLIVFYDIFKMQEIYDLSSKYKFKQPRIG